MKRFVLIPLILTIIMSFAIIKVASFFGEKTEQGLPEQSETAKEDKQEDIDHKQDAPENIVSNDVTDKNENEDNSMIKDDRIFKMLDFDRRYVLSIGQQDTETCSIYCLAYARAFIDNNFNIDPYDYWDDGAVWSLAGFGDIAGPDPLNIVLTRAYDQLDNGRPVIIYTSGIYATTLTDKPQERSASQHFILLIGFRANADKNDLRPSDFYGVDPSNAYAATEENYIPWVVLTDEAPELMLEEYALFAPLDQNVHLKTCLAYPDTIRWDGDTSAAIYPDYVR